MDTSGTEQMVAVFFTRFQSDFPSSVCIDCFSLGSVARVPIVALIACWMGVIPQNIYSSIA